MEAQVQPAARAFFDSSLKSFHQLTADQIIGRLAQAHSQQLENEQTNAWHAQIRLLQTSLRPYVDGHIYFEFAIPRMGKRADVVILVEGVVFVLEFKVGAHLFNANDRRQTESYALDLKSFHQGSHQRTLVPILIATEAPASSPIFRMHPDGVYDVISSNGANLETIIEHGVFHSNKIKIEASVWSASPYQPTPTIIEAAQALYADHSVENIARSDSGAKNLATTSSRLKQVIHHSRIEKRKSICFVTGVPGSGKTLVGLSLATSTSSDEQAVFLSGNGPLVEVLREALSRDEVARTPGLSKDAASRHVKSFIQNVHHFRDEAIKDVGPPHERVVVFDEAQRAWDRESTSRFMQSKRGQIGFNVSEPTFLLQYMDRHPDWCVVVALIGGGQEINTGEAGLLEWRDSLASRFPHWDVYYSDRIDSSEYAGAPVEFTSLVNVIRSPEPSLHLASSMRSFRTERLSSFVHFLVDGDQVRAERELMGLRDKYPIVVTRDIDVARNWIRNRARGRDAVGLVAASKALRLKPYGIFVKSKPSITDWFLNPPEDVRSSNMLEDSATEFDVQGLELDWTIVAWDADYAFRNGTFQYRNFRGTTWQSVHQESKQRYLANTYRVLLTRARQGMVIFVPTGCNSDATREPSWYDGTFDYLVRCGVEVLE